MKREKANTNKLIFITLIALLTMLFLFPLLYKIFPGLQSYSDEDFENETLAKAYFFSQNKNYEKEISCYLELSKKIPALQSEMDIKISKALYNKGNYIEAIRYLNKVLQTGYADSAQIFYNTAMIAHRIKNYEIAVKYYKKSNKNDIYASDANFNLGNISFFINNNKQAALNYYLKAIEIPSPENAYKKMLIREMKVYPQRKYPEVYQTLKSKLSKQSSAIDFSRFDTDELQKSGWEDNQAIVHNYIGTIYAMNNKNKLALKYFNRALFINSEFKDAIINRQKILKLIKQ